MLLTISCFGFYLERRKVEKKHIWTPTNQRFQTYQDLKLINSFCTGLLLNISKEPPLTNLMKQVTWSFAIFAPFNILKSHLTNSELILGRKLAQFYFVTNIGLVVWKWPKAFHSTAIIWIGLRTFQQPHMSHMSHFTVHCGEVEAPNRLKL